MIDIKMLFHVGEILHLSIKMIKIHRIDDHVLNQIIKYNGIEYCIEDFIESGHQFGMNDKNNS